MFTKKIRGTLKYFENSKVTTVLHGNRNRCTLLENILKSVVLSSWVMIGQTHKQTNRDYNFIYINIWILAWEPSFVWKIKLDTKIQGMVMKNTGYGNTKYGKMDMEIQNTEL